jgi:hypothetical protein
VTLGWTSDDASQAFVAVYADAAYTTTIESQVVNGTGTGPYVFSYPVNDQTPGQKWWRVVNRFTGSAGTVNGTFSTGGTYFVDGPPTNQKVHLFDAWYNYPHDVMNCALQAGDFSAKPTLAPYPAASAHGYDQLVLYAETFAPLADFATFGWWESWNGYPPHTRDRVFFHTPGCGDITLGWMSASPAFALGTALNPVDLVDPVVNAYVLGVNACTQYGLTGDRTTLGACSTLIFGAQDGGLPVAPYAVFSPDNGTYPSGTAITISGGPGFADPLFAPVVFYYTTNGTDPLDGSGQPTAAAIQYTGPITPGPGTYTITARSNGSGFQPAYATRNATYTITP